MQQQLGGKSFPKKCLVSGIMLPKELHKSVLFCLLPGRSASCCNNPGQLVLHILHGLPLQNTSWPRIPRGTLG